MSGYVMEKYINAWTPCHIFFKDKNQWICKFVVDAGGVQECQDLISIDELYVEESIKHGEYIQLSDNDLFKIASISSIY